MIRALFFDVDNTLIDFRASSRQAMNVACKKHGIPATDMLFDTFRRINRSLWERLEAGALTAEALHATRWNLIFDAAALQGDGVAFEADFAKGLNEAAVPIPGAKELLSSLAPRFPLYVASNSSNCQQRHRLALAGLLPYFSEIFTSQDIGAPKPTRTFFDACFRSLPGLLPAESVMIGDSLTADIRGGFDYGMQTCWYNPAHAPAPTDFLPDMTAYSLAEIGVLLGG